jgi:hypothetical protein
MRTCLWAGLLIGFWYSPANAQSAVGGPRIEASWVVSSGVSAPSPAATTRHEAALSRGEKGALAGALALGATAAVIRASMCESGESCTGPTIGWGLMEPLLAQC